jgi:hypothetical protein
MDTSSNHLMVISSGIVFYSHLWRNAINMRRILKCYIKHR